MTKEKNIRHDPLYRIIDKTEEMKEIENAPFFNKLKEISSLEEKIGAVPI